MTVQGVQLVKRLADCPDNFRRPAETGEKRRTGLRIHEEEEQPNYYAEIILVTTAKVRKGVAFDSLWNEPGNGDTTRVEVGPKGGIDLFERRDVCYSSEQTKETDAQTYNRRYGHRRSSEPNPLSRGRLSLCSDLVQKTESQGIAYEPSWASDEDRNMVLSPS